MQREEWPRSLVGGLILAEPNLGGVRVHVERFLQSPERYRVQHFQTDNGQIIAAIFLTPLLQIPVQFAGHQQDLLDLRRITGGVAVGIDEVRVINHRVEALDLGEVLHGGGRHLVTQHRLRRRHDQRTAKITQGMTPEKVEVVRRRGRLSHSHGSLSAQLQVALDTHGGVVRTHALIAVR